MCTAGEGVARNLDACPSQTLPAHSMHYSIACNSHYLRGRLALLKWFLVCYAECGLLLVAPLPRTRRLMTRRLRLRQVATTLVHVCLLTWPLSWTLSTYTHTGAIAGWATAESSMAWYGIDCGGRSYLPLGWLWPWVLCPQADHSKQRTSWYSTHLCDVLPPPQLTTLRFPPSTPTRCVPPPPSPSPSPPQTHATHTASSTTQLAPGWGCTPSTLAAP